MTPNPAFKRTPRRRACGRAVLIASLFAAGAASAQIAPPQLSMQYIPSALVYNGLTTQQLVLSNPNPGTTLNGVSFSEFLSFALAIEYPPGLTINCTAGSSATFSVASDGFTISMTNGTLVGGGICTMNIALRAINIVSGASSTSFVTSNNAPPGNPAIAFFVVGPAPPTVTKSFGAAAIPLNGETTLTFNVINPNIANPLDPGFTDVLPPGLVFATPLGIANDTCGGWSASPGGNSLLFTRNFRAFSCSFTLNVVGIASGVQNNVTSVVSSIAGNSPPATATIEVAGPPTIAKSFDASNLPIDGTATLRFTLANPNTAIALSGVAFRDTLPAGMHVANPNGLVGSCGGGSIVAVAGSDSVTLTAATLSAAAQCTFSLKVVVAKEATYTNVTSAVASTEGGIGGSASATLVAILSASPIPTVRGWSVAILVLLVGVAAAAFALRRDA